MGAILSQGSSLIVSIITARLLGNELFGKYGILQGTVMMLGTFAGAALGLTATKYVAHYRLSEPDKAGRIIALGCTFSLISGGIVAGLLFGLAPWLATRTLAAPELTTELRIASILLFLNALAGAQSGGLAGLEAFRSIAHINMTRAFITIPASALAVNLWQLPGAMWALTGTAALTCVLSHITLRQHCERAGIPWRLQSGWNERRLLWTFSAPAFLAGALAGPAMWSASAILVNQPNGYAEMGTFTAATQWRTAIGFIPGVLAQFALPLLSNLNGERDVLRYAKALRWNLLLAGAIAFAIAGPVALFASKIMALYGREFHHGSTLLVLSAVVAVVTCVNSVVGTAIVSAGSMWAGCAFNAMWALAFLIACHQLIPKHLALGLTLSLLLAYLAHTVWQAIYLRRTLVDPRVV